MNALERKEQALNALLGCRVSKPHKHPSKKKLHVPIKFNGEHVPGNVFSQCRKKAAYDSNRFAERVCERILKERGVSLRVYSCDFCGKYHLSKKLNKFEEREN